MSENQVKKRSPHLSNLFSCLYSLPSYLQVASTNRHSRQLKKLYSVNQFHLCRAPSLLHLFIRMMPGNLKAADIAPPETSWMRRGKWWKNATNELALKTAHLFINICRIFTTIRLRESALCPWGCNQSPTVSDLKTRMYSGVSRSFLWNLLKSGNARTCKTHRFTTRSFGLIQMAYDTFCSPTSSVLILFGLFTPRYPPNSTKSLPNVRTNGCGQRAIQSSLRLQF